MALDLYDISTPCFAQSLSGLSKVLHKGRKHAEASGVDLQSYAETRLFADMYPLSVQVQRAIKHSLGALQEIEDGAFQRPADENLDYGDAERCVADALQSLQVWTRERINAFAGKTVKFEAGPFNTSYSAEAFLLSFQIPSFYFHVSTAYDILRMKGVPVGKLDYLGPLRTSLD